MKLARAPGSREARWAHLLSRPAGGRKCGRRAQPIPAETCVAIGEIAALKAHQAALEAELGRLRELVERLYRELGVARD